MNASDKVDQFSPGNLASSTTKTGRHDIAEILLKVAWKHQKSNQIKSIHVFTICHEMKIQKRQKTLSTNIFYFYQSAYYSIHYLHIIINILQNFKHSYKWIIPTKK